MIRLITDEPEEAEAAFAGSYAPVRVLPPHGALHLDVGTVVADGVAVFHSVSDTGVIFQSDAMFDGYNIAVADRGTHRIADISGSHLTHSSSALISDGRLVTSTELGAHTQLRGIAISTDVMHSHLASLLGRPLRKRVIFNATMERQSPTIQAALAISDALTCGLSGDAPLARAPAAIKSLQAGLVSLVLHGIPNNFAEDIASTNAPQLSPAHVRRPMEFMESHAFQPLTISDVAKASGVSVRSLQLAFQHFKGCSPLEFLREIRLSGTRRDLLDPSKPSSVSAIALSWGFAHLGMFAKRYRDAFGESPSRTLAGRVQRR
jgi:transcriptional regulator GlxA family with amidase domain